MKVSSYIYISAVLCAAAGLSAATPEEELHEGMQALMRYDFSDARSHLNKYKELARKSGEPISAVAEDALASIPAAEDMLAGQVEQIVILDSISVATSNYIDTYDLSRPSGRLFVPASLEDMGGLWAGMTPYGPTFESEDGMVRYVGALSADKSDENESGYTQSRLYEAVKLDNGVWTDPVALFDDDVDAAFPYMMSDGCTFYFASRSEEGLGGWDIFRSYRDSEDGTFRNPVNIGMPYNSPGDDYMLVIDEYAGVGRWTTDRHEQYADSVEKMDVVYIYIPSDVRKNYDANTPGIKQLAALWTLHSPQETPVVVEGEDTTDVSVPVVTQSDFIPGYKLTWPTGADYTELFEAIKTIKEENKAWQTTPEDFRFEGPGGKIYTNYDMLPYQSRHLMQQYQEALSSQQVGEAELSQLRAKYNQQPDASSRKTIDLMQQRVDELRRQTVNARNALFESLK